MKTVDPVCDMEISEHEGSFCMDYENKHYCFCSEDCLQEFRDNPEMYVEKSVTSEPMM